MKRNWPFYTATYGTHRNDVTAIYVGDTAFDAAHWQQGTGARNLIDKNERRKSSKPIQRTGVLLSSEAACYAILSG
ncbi:hypothetical protein GWN42_03795 [candidate division KSB1 bacterium]|nr:hypothetical protein [candidate division KSB1 bacterium]NIS27250.1 hypothetical protein [candidate division KSB1 bacterium]NIU27984.1 hypothetical protein [candidate division KSB1 bacterium]NIU92683.1 hypothetical protein [candidate division KSB1 bacterium]NIV91931.1 hypothetical protein [candidate division KSB1 bacterium]